MALVASGYTVWITGRNSSSLMRAARTIGATGVVADVSSPQDWDKLLREIKTAGGKLEILINNAGGGVKIAPTSEQTDAEIAQSIAVNLTGVIYGCSRIAPILSRHGFGTIINISSICSRHAWAGWGVYSAAKAGLEQFAKSLYLELRPRGVRVMSVIPSWGATEFTESAGLGGRDRAIRRKCIQPAELGKIVADLCALPSHLCVQEIILWPMVQEVSPL